MGLFFALPDWLQALLQTSAKKEIILLAMAAQVLVTLWVYNHVGRARMQAGRERRITAETYAIVGEEPDDLRLLTRALANQFELPVLFYVASLIAIMGYSTWLAPLAAWGFVAARIAHLREMIGPNRVMRRRKLFFYGMAPVLYLLFEGVLSLGAMAFHTLFLA